MRRYWCSAHRRYTLLSLSTSASLVRMNLISLKILPTSFPSNTSILILPFIHDKQPAHILVFCQQHLCSRDERQTWKTGKHLNLFFYLHVKSFISCNSQGTAAKPRFSLNSIQFKCAEQYIQFPTSNGSISGKCHSSFMIVNRAQWLPPDNLTLNLAE